MYHVSVDYSFAAGHALRGYKGKCENVHGHNYKVRVTVSGEKLDATGLLVDFVDLRGRIRQLVDRLDHHFLNDLPPFDRLNPSAENIAQYFSEELTQGLPHPDLCIHSVTVWETDLTSATYFPS